jgi:hypothetical protein
MRGYAATRSIASARPSRSSWSAYRRRVPSALGGGDRTARPLLARQPVIAHGDGTSLWTLTHASDFARPFVRLLGNPGALRERLPHHRRERPHRGRDPDRDGPRARVEAQLVHVASDALVRYEPA